MTAPFFCLRHRLMEDAYDRLETRCPRLGHEVTFAYCRREAGDLPCSRAMACWEDRIPVAAFFAESLGKQNWERYRGRKERDKITTLLEIIEAAKRRRAERDGGGHGD